MKKIYLAAPLTREEDFLANEEIARWLRSRGFLVYMPQEHGILDDTMNREDLHDYELVKKWDTLFLNDLHAMSEADACITFIDGTRRFSEGQLLETGWFFGKGKPIYLLNPKRIQVGVTLSGMVPHYFHFTDIRLLVEHLVNEDFS